MSMIQRKSGFFLSYIQIFLSCATGVFFTPFLIYYLGDNDYGLYQLLYATVGYFAILDFGIGSSLTRFIIKYKTENNSEAICNIIHGCFWSYLIIAVLVIIMTVGFVISLQSFFSTTINSSNIFTARIVVLTAGLGVALSLFSHAFQGIATAYEKYVYIKGIRVLKDILRISILVSLLLAGFGLITIVIVDFFFILFVLLVDWYYCSYKLKIRFTQGNLDKSLLFQLLSFSFFAFLQIAITQINVNMGRVFLGRYSTLTLVGLYGVIMQIYFLFNAFGGIIPSISLPQISEVVFQKGDRAAVTQVCIKFGRYQFFLLMPLAGGLILFGESFFSLWVGDNFDPHVLWLGSIILIIPFILEFIEAPIFHVMKAKNLQKARSILLFLIMIFNCLSLYWSIKYMPLYGVAITSAVSIVIGNGIVCNIYYHLRVGIDIIYFLKKTLGRLLILWILTIILAFPLTLLHDLSWIILFIQASCYCIIFSGLMWLWGFNMEERLLYKNSIQKIINIIHRKNILPCLKTRRF